MFVFILNKSRFINRDAILDSYLADIQILRIIMNRVH